MEKKNAIVEFLTDDLKRTALFVTLAGISLVISFFFGEDFPVDPAWVAIILCGTPILYEAVTGLILRHDIKADVLVAVAIVASPPERSPSSWSSEVCWRTSPPIGRGPG